ncbi:hypothetical protein SEVIR_2G328300v4 [Setaria viridis]|uniref:Uncharacterized protein n=1 Tax=Setaria viridis TaxID=4556 RepID=A0A4U6WAN8_SETVI|nr:hypothetical protein SEVIR_2G328300v2 [Setaria viridis]
MGTTLPSMHRRRCGPIRTRSGKLVSSFNGRGMGKAADQAQQRRGGRCRREAWAGRRAASGRRENGRLWDTQMVTLQRLGGRGGEFEGLLKIGTIVEGLLEFIF